MRRSVVSQGSAAAWNPGIILVQKAEAAVALRD
jgi:hypothetical protein